MGKLKVVIADDHGLMLQAIRAALEPADDIEIVGEAHTGSQVLPLLAQTGADLVLMDVRMPQMDGLTALRLVRERYPEVKVVMLSGLDEPEVIEQALRRGASAYVLKHIDPRDLASALRQAQQGTVLGAFGQLEAPETTLARDMGLTGRELTVLKALAQGASNKQIAGALFLTQQTIKFHLTNVYRKLGVSNRTEAARYAYDSGLLELPALEAARG